MSIERVVQVVCDRCGTKHPGVGPTAIAVRRIAHKDGWRVNGGEVCSQCRPTQKETSA